MKPGMKSATNRAQPSLYRRLPTTLVLLAGVVLADGMFGSIARADDVDGVIESVNLDRQTFVLDGIVFHVTSETEFEDELRGFVDLVKGLEVEVDYRVEGDRHIATEIELDD